MQSLATETAPSRQIAPAARPRTRAAPASSVDRPSRVPGCRGAGSTGLQHVGAEVLDRLELPIGRPNCSRTLAYSTAVSRHQRATPDASAAASVTTTDRSRAGSSPGTVVPSRPVRSATQVRRVRSGDAPGVRSTESSGTSTTSSPRTTSACVAPGASWTTSPPRASATRISPAATGPASSPSTTDATAVPSNGPGTSAPAAASSATARSISEPPAPPCSAGTAIPAKPMSATAFDCSAYAARGSSSACRAASIPPSEAAHLPKASASSTWSSLIPIGTGFLLASRRNYSERVPILPQLASGGPRRSQASTCRVRERSHVAATTIAQAMSTRLTSSRNQPSAP